MLRFCPAPGLPKREGRRTAALSHPRDATLVGACDREIVVLLVDSEPLVEWRSKNASSNIFVNQPATRLSVPRLRSAEIAGK
jgi:hypothetical protein